jgi:nuclear GTP-binding protein
LVRTFFLKIDLIPKEALQKWLAYLRQEHPTIAFKASTQNQKNNISRSNDSGPAENAPSDLLRNEGCLGADSLMKLLKNYCRSEDIKRNITVGIIGYPNVGKSSVINSLKRTKSAKVGSTPGVTRLAQEFYLDKHIKLLDSPGIIFSSGQLDSDIILRNAIRIEKLDDPVVPVTAIINRCRKEQLLSKYNVEDFKDAQDFLNILAKQRGKLKKGNVPNVDEVAKIILRDWNTGKIPFFTLPPKQDKDYMIEDGQDWSAYDDSIMKSDTLMSLKDAFKNDFIPMASSKPQQYQNELEDEEDEEEDEEFEDGDEEEDEDDDEDDDIFEEE